MSTPTRMQNAAPRKATDAKKQTPHVNEDFLGLHVLGDLPIFQRSQVEEHLSECGKCRSAQRRVAEVIAVFRTQPCGANA